MEWTLERMNVAKNFIVLDKNNTSFSCGRALSNKIVCPSLVVSRKHCMFVRDDNSISIIDFQSSNGCFVNGKQIETNTLFKLRDNDLIGIGSSDEYKDNEPMFLYKLHKGNLGSRNLEEFDELLTQKSSGSSNIIPIPNASVSVITTAKSNNFLKRNLLQKNTDREVPVLPPKLAKLSNENEEIRNNVRAASRTSAETLLEAEADSEIEEIQEIWSVFKSSPKINGKECSPVSAARRTEICSNKSNKRNLDIEDEDRERQTVKNNETRTLDRKTERQSVESEPGFSLSEKYRAKAKNEKNKSPILEAATSLSSQNNSQKKVRSLFDSTPNNTRFVGDILENKEDEGREKKNRICLSGSSGGEEGEEKKAKKRESLEHLKEKSKELPNKREDRRKCSPESPPPSVNVNFVKLEDDRLSFLNKQPVACSSPFKLKHVKQEPMTSFSVINTVDLSDDDDDIFPSSQLFDSTAESSFVKVEDENRFVDMDAARHESEEIITLSDSDDEENPWLLRLSESQRIKEEMPDVTEPDTPAPDSPPMEFFDELFALKSECDEERSTKDVETPKIKAIEIIKTPSPSIMRHRRSLTTSEIEEQVNGNDNDDKLECDISQTFNRDKAKTSNDKSAEHSPRKIQEFLKGPLVIEPLRLPQRKRRSNKDLDSSVASTSKSGFGLKDCSVAIPKLSTKREKELADRLKQKKYEEEQKIRRIKNKWVQSIPLPLGKRKSPAITKNQKLQIVNDRKEKLKAIATKQKAESVKPSVERIAAKPKAKISVKNRGDFLINDQLGTTSENQVESGESTSKNSKIKSKISPTTCGEASSSKKTMAEKTSASKSDSKTNKRKSTATEEKKRLERRCESVEKNAAGTSVQNLDMGMTECLKELSLNQKENRVPNSLDKNVDKSKKKKKKVSFSDKLVEVRVFEIDPNNTMKKCTGKDALIPKHKLMNAKKINQVQQPQLEEFLMHIFKWNPLWLEEQKRLNTDPPIVNYDTLIPLLTSYKCYMDYYQTLKPLLLLELWYGISKEFETIDRNSRRRTLLCSIVKNSIGYQPIATANTSLTTLMLEVLASEDDVRRHMHPVYGDLIFLELTYRDENGTQKFEKVFAYVTGLYKTQINQHTIFNRDLLKHTANPTRVLTYTVSMKSLGGELCVNRLFRLRCVTYLRANMRMVQALQSLPKSPLLDFILSPKIEQYQLINPATNIYHTPLVTGDKLNQKQMEAVLKTTEVVIRKEPKICLVQGPPGTGKSEVIVNMVMQILYGNDRYIKNRDATLRILLCAPSNAAIDEIVLRLLDRRAKLQTNRFKMVRVGLQGPMHPRVRDISLEELAKRDVKKTITSYHTCGGESMSSVEEEKRYLEARINALQSELNSSQRKDEKRTEYNRIKLSEMRAKFELIKNCSQTNGSNIDHMKLQRGAESKILVYANIIACTLSSCYTNIMESSFGGSKNSISVCIVDEATQCCETETLIPLMLGVNTLVLVGDPAQLPATVISQTAKKLGLDQSLFSRAQGVFEGTKNSPVITLDTQYRMNAQICRWPNDYFYASQLKNGINGDKYHLPFHPYRLLNLTDSYQNSDKYSNTQEAEFVSNLIYGMINHLDGTKLSSNVSFGVITPYRNQQTVVQGKINQRLSSLSDNRRVKINVEVNTVDSFQGRECDVIIMSCVRSNGIGFLADRQRLCVALTRAKHCLILCGNFSAFQRDTMWRALLADAHSRKIFIEMRTTANPNKIVSELVR